MAGLGKSNCLAQRSCSFVSCFDFCASNSKAFPDARVGGVVVGRRGAGLLPLSQFCIAVIGKQSKHFISP